MIRKSLVTELPVFLSTHDSRNCKCIASFVLVQCLIVFLTSITVLKCVWDPHLIAFDPYKLASIMYLYDKTACGYTTHVEKVVSNLQLSNDTKGFNVLPIRWEPAVVTVSTRLSKKTRWYIELSIGIHAIWMLLTIVFKIIVVKNSNPLLLFIAINVYFFTLIIVNIFDLSMAVVYITQIKQSLTKGMIIRYSGWSVELKIKNYDDFAGYIPMIASACWMRGIIVQALNIYSCKKINDIRTKIKRREVMTRMITTSHKPFPEAKQEQVFQPNTLYYRAGENKPYVNNYF